tara:strand:+ start:704 stop:868 length:165 start_codon:yes stop_codon:yes gene_type:complete
MNAERRHAPSKFLTEKIQSRIGLALFLGRNWLERRRFTVEYDFGRTGNEPQKTT